MKILLNLLIVAPFFLCSTDVFPSPLLDASAKGDTERVINIVNQGTDINQKNEWGFTPLMFAIKNNNTNLVSFLLSKGADKHLKSDDGHDAFNLITSKTNQSIVLMINANSSEGEPLQQNILSEIKLKIENKNKINWNDVSKLYSILEKSRSEIINNLPKIGENNDSLQ